MRARIVAFAAALAAVSAAVALPGRRRRSGAPTSCRATHWCTITADGDLEPGRGAVRDRQRPARHRRSRSRRTTSSTARSAARSSSGELAGTCAWSQYQRDWAPLRARGDPPAAPSPVLRQQPSSSPTSGTRRSGRAAIRRCFGGVPLRLRPSLRDRGGRTFCYSRATARSTRTSRRGRPTRIRPTRCVARSATSSTSATSPATATSGTASPFYMVQGRGRSATGRATGSSSAAARAASSPGRPAPTTTRPATSRPSPSAPSAAAPRRPTAMPGGAQRPRRRSAPGRPPSTSVIASAQPTATPRRRPVANSAAASISTARAPAARHASSARGADLVEEVARHDRAARVRRSGGGAAPSTRPASAAARSPAPSARLVPSSQIASVGDEQLAGRSAGSSAPAVPTRIAR